MKTVKTKISWEHSKPTGLVELLIGPGASIGEIMVYLLSASGSGIFLIFYNTRFRDIDWSYLQGLVVFFLAWDLIGGLVALNTSSAKRYWNSPGSSKLTGTLKLKPLSVAFHLLRPLAVALFLRANDWRYFGLISLYLLLGSTVIGTVSLCLKRPVAAILLVGGFLFELYYLGPTPGLEWFALALYSKVFMALLVREEPYRPC